jgi:FkbM family methyltransferase
MRRIGERIFGPVARAFGYRLVPKKRLKHWVEIDLTRRLLERFDVDCVIDVGANRGQFRDQLRDAVGWDGRLESVEPQPDLAARLRERAARDPRWAIHECALGGAPGRARFNVTAGDVYGSLLAPRADADASVRDSMQVVRQVDVEVRTLDALVDEAEQRGPIRRPFLKLDTQGFDLEVLSGATRVLERVVAVQTELSFKALYEGMPDWQESVTRLQRLGFEVSGFAPIEPHAQFPAALELNGFFVNSRRVG